MPHTEPPGDEPADFLVENATLLSKGRVLDIAMGSGRNAIYLARLGFQVEGVDISGEAIQTALAAAQTAGVAITANIADLEKISYIQKGDWDAIICFNYLQRSLIPDIKNGLKPGGVLIYETFITDQAELFGKPKNPDFLLKHNELLDMFRDFRCLRYREGVIGQRAIAGIVARKPAQI
jgi:tellurite methyltransferase